MDNQGGNRGIQGIRLGIMGLRRISLEIRGIRECRELGIGMRGIMVRIFL